MKLITLSVGLCHCIKDWHGKFNGHQFKIGERTFVFREKIIDENEQLRNFNYHFWIDRHYVKYGFLDYHTFDTFITLYEWQSVCRGIFVPKEGIPISNYAKSCTHVLFDLWWRSRKKARVSRVLSDMERLVQKAQEKHGRYVWWKPTKRMERSPVLLN